jgi:hypothetical protein
MPPPDHPNERSQSAAEQKAWNDFRDLTAAYLKRVRALWSDLAPHRRKQLRPYMELLKALIWPFGEK